MSHTVRFTATARRDLHKLPPRVLSAVIEFAFGDLAREPRRAGKPLRRELAGFYSARRGPYRVLRHPSYTGLLLAIAGCGLMLGTLVGTAAAVVLVSIALVYRLRKEELALTAALGDRYRQFAAWRARLIPYVW